MSGQWIFIEAQDVWMFRDNKPFTAGQNFVARSIFPPTPQTMQGVLRSHYLEHQHVNWRDYAHQKVDSAIRAAVGVPAYQDQPAEFGKLVIRGPWVARRSNEGTVDILYRVPSDLMQHKEMPDVYALMRPEKCDFETDVPFENWLPLMARVSDTHNYEAAEGWMTSDQMEAYLSGDVESIGQLMPSPVVREERVGLALDYTRRASREDDSLFYRANFTRPHDGIGLLVQTNIDLMTDNSGLMNIGGESRSANYAIVQAKQAQAPLTAGRIKVILQTPAYFDNGAMPQNDDWRQWFGDNVRFVSAAIGTPMLIGGWDVARGKPKPIRSYVPPGSVYYFEDAAIPEKPFTQTPGEDMLDLGAMGFGTVVLTNW